MRWRSSSLESAENPHNNYITGFNQTRDKPIYAALSRLRLRLSRKRRCDHSHDMSKTAQAQGAAPPSKKEHLFKVIVIGNPGTGKTSIIKRYVHGFYSSQYKATIGVDFALKVIQLDDNTVIRLQIWDIAGQERAGTMSRVYYKEAVAAFIVFDVTRKNTFDAVGLWKTDVDQKVFLPDDKPVPVILLANKWDLISESFLNNDSHMLDDYCKDKGFVSWFKTSAKDNIGLEEAAKALVLKILEIKDCLMLHEEEQNTVDLDRVESRKSGCGCGR